jgi:uncharacterized membrane protein
MKRVNVFLTILIASLAALIATTAAGFAIFTSANQQTGSDWFNQMWSGMGGMMGQTATPATAAANSSLAIFGVLFAVFIGLTVVGIVGLAYYLVYPQMRFGTVPAVTPTGNVAASATQAGGAAAYESVSKTLTAEERRVIEVLNAHGGKYLQKYVKAETGLSRLKTHRILARLADRGIVTLEKTGNTNQVQLANWLQQN